MRHSALVVLLTVVVQQRVGPVALATGNAILITVPFAIDGPAVRPCLTNDSIACIIDQMQITCASLPDTPIMKQPYQAAELRDIGITGAESTALSWYALITMRRHSS